MDGDERAHDLDCLQNAVNDSARDVSILWSTFTLLGLYLAIAAASVTHRDLFLDDPIQMPVLNVPLPVDAFFVVAPLVYVIAHAYLLLQLMRMVTKLAAWQHELRARFPNPADRRLMIMRLTDFPFLQFLAERDHKATSIFKFSLIAISWLTLTLFPLIVLLEMEIVFLPDHIERITWLHRSILIIEFAMAWTFWIAMHWRERVGGVEISLFVPGVLLTAAILTFSTFFATFPSEADDKNPVKWGIEGVASWFTGTNEPITHWLFDGDIDLSTGRIGSPFVNRIVLFGGSFYDDDKHRAGQPSVSLKGRNLRDAILQNVDLRYADFRGADLQGAHFGQSQLDGARFDCPRQAYQITDRHKYRHDSDDKSKGATGAAQRTAGERVGDQLIAFKPTSACTMLSGADMTGVHAPGAVFDRATLDNVSFLYADLHGATFARTSLDRTQLSGAQLQGTQFIGAKLRAANLFGAQMDGAVFEQADLSGASLARARLRGADFRAALLQGTILDDADLTAAALIDARLEGASFKGATLTGAVFGHAQAQGTDFSSADLTAASFAGAQLQGADLEDANLDFADFDGVNLFRTKLGAVRGQPVFAGIELAPVFPKLVNGQHGDWQPAGSGLALDKDIGYQAILERTDLSDLYMEDAVKVRDRLGALDPATPGTTDAANPAWSLQMPTSPALVAARTDGRWAALTRAMCATSDEPFVLRALLRDGQIAGAGKAGLAMIAALRDTSSCYGARSLTNADTNAVLRVEEQLRLSTAGK